MPRKAEIGAIAIVVFALAIGFAVYPQLPDNYASHWNFSGEIDGYLPKSWGLFLMPAVMVIFVTILSLVPCFDRFPDNVRSFTSGEVVKTQQVLVGFAIAVDELLDISRN